MSSDAIVISHNSITIFGIEIAYYGVLILLGMLIAISLTINEAKKYGIGRSFVTNMAFWVIIFGILGARLWYVLFNLDFYLKNPNEIYMIWHGGLAIHGGLIFGMLTIINYCRKYHVRIFKMLDIVAPYVLLAQAIGRWGNFFNQEAYGSVTSLEALKGLKIIPDFVINGMYIEGHYYHPMFYYEFLWCLLGMIVLLIFRSIKYTHIGQTAGLYMVWYSVGRYFIESMRMDSLMLGDIKVAQLMSIILFIAGLVIIIVQARKPKLEELYNDRSPEKITF